MNIFIKLMITYFIEQQLGVAHEAAAKAVEQLDMSYALSKFEHELRLAKEMSTHLSEDTINGAINEITRLCADLQIKRDVEQFVWCLKQYVLTALNQDNVKTR